jgi:TatD DNase family protein
MNLFDTHCHIDAAAFDEDRNQVLERCAQAGVSQIVVPGIRASGWDRLQEICDQHAVLSPSYGLHPVYLQHHGAKDVDALAARIERQRPVAVGEIGLDFYLPELNREQQQILFEAQLNIAADAALPVLLHARKSHDAVLSSLRKIAVCGGICHAFNGSLQQAHQYLDLGFKLGFGGMLTFERSHKLHRLVQQLPLDAIVLETDAPDMTGARHHGQRNSPEYLPEVLQALANLREESSSLIATQTTANAQAVLNFPQVFE